MVVPAVLEAVVGGLLLFVVPGFTVARALFPEWRFHGPDGARHALETATLSFVLSVVLTVLIGTALLGLAPGGFAAAWTDPVLETALAAVALVGLIAGILRGSYSKVAPVSRAHDTDPGGEGAWELSRELDRLHREDRELALRMRHVPADGEQAAAIAGKRAELIARIEAIERDREAEYAR